MRENVHNFRTQSTNNGKASGVQVDPHCKDVFNELHLGKIHRYIIFKLSDDLQKIVVDSVGDKCEKHDDFVAKLIEAGNNKQGRYGVFDCDYDKDKSNKIILVMWLPDTTVGIKQKMLYTSSKKVLKDALVGVAKEIQANDLDDLTWAHFVEICASKY